MSLDPFIHPNSEIQALINVSGARAWKLWAPHVNPSSTPHGPAEVYLTLRNGDAHADAKIYHAAPVDEWRATLAVLLDKMRTQEPV